MSIEHRMSRNKHGERTLTIKLVGNYDIVRFATHLLSGQSEFAAMGWKVIRSQKRAYGAKRWREALRPLYGDNHPSLPHRKKSVQ